MIPKINLDKMINTLNGVVDYGRGFVDTVRAKKTEFNQKIGFATVVALYEYIDAMAAIDSGRLSHVYEPGMLGQPNGRLFDFDLIVTDSYIQIIGRFLESRVASSDTAHVFRDRAEVMESGVTITMEPVNAEAMAFMDDGELVFVSGAITVEHPGGPDAENGFGETVRAFIDGYASKGIIDAITRKMASPIAFKQGLSRGNLGRSAGATAANKYMDGMNEFI